MERKRKHTLLPAVTLPNDLIQEILLKLPVRSLSRFKCVSKSWLSLIRDPQFVEYHYESVSVAPTQGLVRVKLYDHDDWRIQICSIDTDASLHDNSANLVVFNVPKITEYRVNGHVRIVGSCRGFLLLAVKSNRVIYFLIWNPLTGFQKRFKKDMPNRPYLCGLGYDSSTHDYVVVMLTLQLSGTLIHCFSCKTNSWAFTNNITDWYQYGNFCEEEFDSLFNGALHWVVYSNSGFKVIAFNVMEKTLVDISLPPRSINQFCYLRVMEGCLCLYFPQEKPEMWIMKEYKVQASWVKLFAFSNFSRYFRPTCFTKNGEILGLDCVDCVTLVKVNDKGKLLESKFLEQRCAHGLFAHIYGLVHYRGSLLSFPGPSEDQQQ